MHPILFRIPMPGWDLPLVGKLDAIPIYSYGVMLGLSLVVGWYLTLGLAKRDGLPREKMANCYVITAIVAVVASRLLYVVTNLDEFETFWDLFSMRRGGLAVYGGFIGGFVAAYAYLKSQGMRIIPFADVAVPSLAAGLGITRVGCYLFGCDYGQPLSADAPAWLKRLGAFPHWPAGTLPGGADGAPAWVEHVRTRGLDPSAVESLPVHPTQIYESVAGLSLLALLLLVRKRQKFRGQIFFMATFGYGAMRFLLEILRDDPERGNVPGTMPEHLLLSGALVLFGIGYAIGIARIVEAPMVRKVTQALAFVPAVVAYFVLRPESFAGANLMQLSTSQFIGLASGLAVCGLYLVYDKAADEHPETAMDLGFLPDESPPDDAAEAAADEADDEEEAPKPKKRRKKKKKKTKPTESSDDDT